MSCVVRLRNHRRLGAKHIFATFTIRKPVVPKEGLSGTRDKRREVRINQTTWYIIMRTHCTPLGTVQKFSKSSQHEAIYILWPRTDQPGFFRSSIRALRHYLHKTSSGCASSTSIRTRGCSLTAPTVDVKMLPGSCTVLCTYRIKCIPRGLSRNTTASFLLLLAFRLYLAFSLVWVAIACVLTSYSSLCACFCVHFCVLIRPIMGCNLLATYHTSTPHVIRWCCR